MDSTRPLTYASCHPGDLEPEQAAICQDLPDICSWAISRLRTMNNKGIVDERRRPKLAFDIVRACFAEAQRNL